MNASRRFIARSVGALLRPGARREEGQAMVEYAMILAGVATVTIVAMNRLDASLGALFARIAASLN